MTTIPRFIHQDGKMIPTKNGPALYAEIDRLKAMNAELADMAALYLRYSDGRGLVGNKSREKLEAIIAKSRGQQ